MPEDQSHDGSLWNQQFSNLLTYFNWEYVGDADFDILTEEDKARGIDRLFTLENPYKKNKELCMLESKRYALTSFNKGKIGEWAKTLEDKITKIKNSENLYELYPQLEGINFHQGIVAIWCPEQENIKAFNKRFIDGLEDADIGSKHSKSMNKLFFLDNKRISRLVSMIIAIKEINTQTTKKKFNFYYHGNKDYASCRSHTLLPSYMIGKFILGDYSDENNTENKVVFYFGILNLVSFKLLRSALSELSYTDQDKPLHIYYYLNEDDSNFRKILPEIKKEYEGLDVKFIEMEHVSKIPTFLKNS
ncbi:hypothetical protein [Sphingobacterium siyangense]|jgi:hypothetical protein|uniref:hypothetical protein n=1 Tax=Sphingobacterium siyangense TaxID=459529 RepID=UPI0028B059C2|nr:hypothetical protein [Sphingobacterium siyangense]